MATLNPFRESIGSELCLRRERLKRPPRLGRPAVEVDVLVEGSNGGVGKCSSSSTLRQELIVDERPRELSGVGRTGTFDDCVDLREALEPLLMTPDPGLADPANVANADLFGDGCVLF